METKFNFKSAVCTSRSQSERLLALGLKKETADMTYQYLNQWDGWFVRPIEENDENATPSLVLTVVPRALAISSID